MVSLLPAPAEPSSRWSQRVVAGGPNEYGENVID